MECSPKPNNISQSTSHHWRLLTVPCVAPYMPVVVWDGRIWCRNSTSNSTNTIYSLACQCGVRYVGESGRNLKVRIQEHKQRSSKSALSLHVKEFEDDTDGEHAIRKESTVVLAQERNARKRRFIESVCIRAKQPCLCNTGTSVTISDMWKTNVVHVTKCLSSLDEEKSWEHYWSILSHSLVCVDQI